MANQIIPQRSEVPEEYTWNLKDLYESDQAWNEEYEALKALPKQIAAFRGTLGRTAEDLLAWFQAPGSGGGAAEPPVWLRQLQGRR